MWKNLKNLYNNIRSTNKLVIFCLLILFGFAWICPSFAADPGISVMRYPDASLSATDFLVEPNVEYTLDGWVEYDTDTCEAVDTGTWQATQPPAHGTLRSGIEYHTATSGDCAGYVFPFNMVYYTWTDTSTSATEDFFSLRWYTADGQYNDYSYWHTILLTNPTVTINSADLVANKISVTLDDLVSLPPGPLSIKVIGGQNTFETSYNNGQNVGNGTYSVSLNRISMPEGVYTKIVATWQLSTGDVVSPDYLISPAWRVYGIVRHTQYNAPYEGNCSGQPMTGWVFDSACNFTSTKFDSKFAAQVVQNGTGSSKLHGLVKYSKSCTSKYPPGANVRNAFLLVPNVTGSCNKVLAGTSEAVFPNPVYSGPPNCGDTTVLVESNTNKAVKQIQDYCGDCKDGHHIDNYSLSEACSLDSLGYYWTAKIGGGE